MYNSTGFFFSKIPPVRSGFRGILSDGIPDIRPSENPALAGYLLDTTRPSRIHNLDLDLVQDCVVPQSYLLLKIYFKTVGADIVQTSGCKGKVRNPVQRR